MPRTPRRKKQKWTLPALLIAILIVLAIILLLPSYAATDKENDEIHATTLVKQGDEAPDFTVEMFHGKPVTLSSLRGKVVLVTFWATWCPPCRQELKHVQHEIIDRFAGRDFQFLPIARGENREAVAAFRTKNGYKFNMGMDPDRTIYDCFASNYIPRNFLINKEGRVVMTTAGFDRDEFNLLIETIEKELR